ncbi:MAG: alcohol dehydrogenase catalytic domain-containing protein [Rhodobiaceae bacterium]
MKALIYDGPESMGFRDAPDPVLQDGEVLIRVNACGICGSDMHAYLGHDERRPAPLILGHEAAGTISGGSRDGERVTVNPLVTCGTCADCVAGRDNLCASRQIISMPPREGAFAQCLSMPEVNVITVPDHVPLEKAALAEPLACGWHASRLAINLVLPRGTSALVIGGGAIGLGSALSLARFGVADIVILEPNADRRAIIGQAGIGQAGGHRAIEPDRLESDSQFDIVVDAVGYAASRAMACKHARPGGVIVHIGLGEASGGIDSRRLTLQEITFMGTYTYTSEDFRNTAAAIFNGDLGTLDWMEMRDLRDGAAAFSDLRAHRVASPKIILAP